MMFREGNVQFHQRRNILCDTDLQMVAAETWVNKRKIVTISLYNPCRKIRIKELQRLENRHRVTWCGDFIGHNTLWGGKITDYNGQVIEEFIISKGLVCLYSG